MVDKKKKPVKKKAVVKRTSKAAFTSKPKSKPKVNKLDVVSEFTKMFDATKATKVSDGYYQINGWRIKFNSRGVYLHTQMSVELPISFESVKRFIQDKGGKPFIPREDLSLEVIEKIVKSATIYKTNQLKKRELKQQEKEKRAEDKRLSKRSWCKGCQFSPQGERAGNCDNMKYSEIIGHFYCSEPKFYENYWCKNAKHSYIDKRKKWTQKFTCKLTNEPCPYQQEGITQNRFLLSRNLNGEHFTSCKDYEGDKKESETKITKKGKVPPNKKKTIIAKRRKTKNG